MSNLLNSGRVGIGEKTEEEILKLWGSIGFLDGIEEEDIKLKVAILYERMASIIINMSAYYTHDGRIDTVIFPIIRRVVTEINNRIDGVRGKGMIHLLESEYILKRVSDMFADAVIFYEKHLSTSNMDIEAECTAWLSQLIAFEYIASFSGKEIIELGDGNFDAVVKLR